MNIYISLVRSITVDDPLKYSIGLLLSEVCDRPRLVDGPCLGLLAKSQVKSVCIVYRLIDLLLYGRVFVGIEGCDDLFCGSCLEKELSLLISVLLEQTKESTFIFWTNFKLYRALILLLRDDLRIFLIRWIRVLLYRVPLSIEYTHLLASFDMDRSLFRCRVDCGIAGGAEARIWILSLT
jgi:hypothetical protein